MAKHRVSDEARSALAMAIHGETRGCLATVDRVVAAGWAPVAEARRQALEEAAEQLEDGDLPGSTASGYYASYVDSGYHEAWVHTVAWLRALAEKGTGS